MRLAPFASLVVASAALRIVPGEHGDVAMSAKTGAASPLLDPAYITQAVQRVLLVSAEHESLGGGEEEAGAVALLALRRGRAPEEERYQEDAVHVCAVAVGQNSTEELSELLRSVLYHRGALRPVFHVITDDTTRSGVREVFRNASWDHAHLISLPTASVSQQLAELHVTSSTYGLAVLSKSFLWQFLPGVERCILIDTDTLLVAPLAELQGVFSAFGERQVVAAVWRSTYRVGNKINTGVVLHDFGRQRASGWPSAVRASHRMMVMAGSRQLADGRLDLVFPDQEILHGALMAYSNETDPSSMPGGLLALDTRWNNELIQKLHGLCSTPPRIAPGILHFNGGDATAIWMCRSNLEPYLPCLQHLVEEHALPAWPPCPN